MLTPLIDGLRALIFAVAHVCNGSLGLAVFLVSLALRLVLLPLTLRLARRAIEQQRRLRALEPELKRLRKRFAKDPAGEMQATAALYGRNNVKPIDPAGLLGALVQLPLFGAFFAALRRGLGAGVRFLGIADLASPSLGTAVVVALLSALGVAVMPPMDPTRRLVLWPLVISAGFTLFVLRSTSALFTIASGAGVAVNVVQGLILRRSERPRSVAATSRDRGPDHPGRTW